MTYNEKKKKYNAQYKKDHFKRIPLEVQNEKYDQIKTAADKVNESVNGYIKKAVEMRIESENEA